jgi:hypothetical protein
MATSQLGLLSSTGSLAAPAGFLAWNWAFAYLALSSRTPKQYFGIDHNGNPRQDLAQHGEAAVREGKMTRAQLDMIQRMEAATANSIDGYTFFAASGKTPPVEARSCRVLSCSPRTHAARTMPAFRLV